MTSTEPGDGARHDGVHLECRAIGKRFGGTTALADVSVTFRRGSVHALVGENGAGKSTLGKIIAGVLHPDEGRLVLRGTPVAFHSPRDALVNGIALVAQELALVPALSVARNVFLGAEPRRSGFLLEGALAERFARLTETAGFDLPSDAPAGSLPIAAQQQVEILRALAREAELLILDEPTAALSRMEAERLHAIVRSLASAGTTVILISHFLREVLDLADTVTILRDGRLVRTSPAADESEASLISGMLGRTVGRTYPDKRPPPDGAPLVLKVRELVASGVHGVSLDVRAGEIVGLAGLIGAGRTELVRAIYGAVPAASGTIELADAPARRSPSASIDAGVGFIPESRKDQGLLLDRPVRENVSLASIRTMSRFGFVRRSTETREVGRAIERSTVRASSAQPARTLSGGNQQKLLFARALLVNPRLLIADEPTRGVDVGAKRAIYELLAELAADGVGVLLVSSEIEEILGLAHRVLVLRGGRVSAELTGARMTEAAILESAFVGAAVPA